MPALSFLDVDGEDYRMGGSEMPRLQIHFLGMPSVVMTDTDSPPPTTQKTVSISLKCNAAALPEVVICIPL